MSFIEEFQHVFLQFLRDYGNFFLHQGQFLYQAIAVSVLVWFGVMTAINSSEYMGGFKWGAFIKLLFLVATCRYLLWNYNGFIHIFFNFVNDISGQLASGLANLFFGPLTKILNGMQKPTNPFNLLLVLVYVVMYLLIAVLKAAAFYVIAFGFLAEGVIVLLGPLFIPFLMVPKLDFIFWGWIKSFIQYGFYPIVANAFLYVIGSFITSQHIYQNLSLPELLSSGIAVVVLFLVSIFSVFKIPTLVNHIFSGMSGAGSSIIPFTGGK